MLLRLITQTVLIVIFLLADDAVLNAQTQAYLDAPVLEKDTDLAITLSNDNKTLLFRPSSVSNFQPLPSLVLAHNPFRVAYFHYNPLTMKVSVNATAADDPAQASLQKLLDALRSVATTVSPAQDSAAKVADPKAAALVAAKANVQAAKVNLKNKQDAVDAAKNVGGAVARKQAIRTATEAQQAAVSQDDQAAQEVAAAQGPADAAKAIQTTIKTASDALTTLKASIPSWSLAIDTAWAPQVTEKEALAAASAKIDESEVPMCADLKPADPTKSIKEQLKETNERFPELGQLDADGVRLLQQYQQVVSSVNGACNSMDQLKHTLATSETWSSWNATGDAYLLQPSVDATLSKQQTLKVTISFITVDTGTLAVKDSGASVTGTVLVRRYRGLLPEIGVGAVFSFIDRPKYGTGKDAAGNTIVALAGTDHVSIAPTVMLNFVCHCDAGGIAPMLQLGAATSTSLPAILMGGGLRLFGTGKGDVALGGGLTLGWYKDLNKLKVGEIISGTADINGDLSFISTPKPAPYLTIQYKF